MRMPLAAAALVLTGAPALAQTAPAKPDQLVAADPARDAAAQRVVARLLPPGTYRRIMRDMFPGMMEAMMGSMSGLTRGMPGDDGKTLEQAMVERDPAFRERLAITMKIMGEEFAPIMDKIEPGVRAALGRTFARRFTLVQLDDLDAFLATPSGTAFGKDFMIAFMDPEMMKEMGEMMPELMKIMPKLMERMEKETAHLPPEPKPEADAPAEDDGTRPI
ncbi:hypothetical protein [Sphingomonas sp.]|jgi:hypothetical protein|uniref:hypothetical protein n=1 Tax=Sphingomonas sp. TaxID=28214 RepID=UPI002EDB6590